MKKQGTERMLAACRGEIENLVYINEKMNSRVLFVLLSLLSFGICRSGDLCVYQERPTFAVCVCQLTFFLAVIPAQYEQSPEIDNF